MEIYLGLGSNEGNREANLKEAISRLDEALDSACVKLSGIIETEPWGNTEGGPFLNAVVMYELDIREDVESFGLGLLRICKEIESGMGRRQRLDYDAEGRRIYHSRCIDIDILLMGPCRINHPHLSVPHLRMFEREFVMKPLREIISSQTAAHYPNIFDNYR